MRPSHLALVLALAGVIGPFTVCCQAAGPSKAEASLAQAAANQEYTFLLFHKEDNQATRALAQTLKTSIGQQDVPAKVFSVSVQDPNETALVKRFGVLRAPLPVAVAVAPNGAMTAILTQKSTSKQVLSAFLTTGMADCMKAMQDGKLVFVCVKPSAQSPVPAAVAQFQADPEFKDRSRLVSLELGDRDEDAFFKQMEIEPSSVKSPVLVFLAPPGVLVGKFNSTVSKAELASALHAAGKCCDDPNCKHNHGPQATKPSNAKRK